MSSNLTVKFRCAWADHKHIVNTLQVGLRNEIRCCPMALWIIEEWGHPRIWESRVTAEPLYLSISSEAQYFWGAVSTLINWRPQSTQMWWVFTSDVTVLMNVFGRVFRTLHDCLTSIHSTIMQCPKSSSIILLSTTRPILSRNHQQAASRGR